LQWRPDTDPQSVLVASTDGSALPALRLTVSWHRSGWFPAAVLLILVGLVVLTSGLHRLTRGHLIGRLLDRLEPHGYLLLGHSETVTGLSARTRSAGPTVYAHANRPPA
jgi:hypothetical protein